MTDLEKHELAIRRAASQMPAGTSRFFRLLADELRRGQHYGTAEDFKMLQQYRNEQDMLD